MPSLLPTTDQLDTIPKGFTVFPPWYWDGAPKYLRDCIKPWEVKRWFMARCLKHKKTHCWKFLGVPLSNGYPQVTVNGLKREVTHVIWEATHKRAFPEGLDAAHICNNRWCCCPHHIVAQIHRHNQEYMVACNRSIRGERHHHVKLTELQVLFIHENREMGSNSLAEQLGVVRRTITSILAGERWNYIFQRIHGNKS